MLDKKYQKALKEVDEVLKYTDINLLKKIPNKFINAINFLILPIYNMVKFN